MKRNPQLVPTPVVDKRGRQTTVYKKPQDAGALKNFPAPAPGLSDSSKRDILENNVTALFQSRYAEMMRDKVATLSDESLNTIVELVGSVRKDLVKRDVLSGVTDVIFRVTNSHQLMDEAVFPYLLRNVDSLTDEFSLSDMATIFRETTRSDGTPASDDELDAHVLVANRYHDSVFFAETNVFFTYIKDKKLMDFVSRHPDKAEVIIRNRATYLPEINGFDDFEADLDMLAEVSKPVSDGWL